MSARTDCSRMPSVTETTEHSAPVTFCAAMPSAFRPLESPPTSTIRAPVFQNRLALRDNCGKMLVWLKRKYVHIPQIKGILGCLSRAGRRIVTAWRGSVAPPLVGRDCHKNIQLSRPAQARDLPGRQQVLPENWGSYQTVFALHHPLTQCRVQGFNGRQFRHATRVTRRRKSGDHNRLPATGHCPDNGYQRFGFHPAGIKAYSTSCMPQINDRHVDPQNSANQARQECRNAPHPAAGQCARPSFAD